VEEDVFSYKGMGYIGTRPTVNGTTRSIEVNLFDFKGDLYGKTLRIKILHFVRHDIRYTNLEDMKNQIADDEVKVRGLFAN
jgi:riboflavin kinase/FMN adenylyltransferase